MPIKIPTFDHEVFKRNFLKSVVCQIRVQPIFRIASEPLPAQFQEKIRKDYPVVQKEESVQVALQGQAVQRTNLGNTWRFKNADGHGEVTLDSAFIAFEAKTYQSFTDFRSRFETVYDAYLSTYEPSRPERIGLRYINMVRPMNIKALKDWERWVKPELMGFLASSQVEEPIVHDFKEFRTVQNPGFMTVRHGLMSDQDKSLIYLIDVDRYIQAAKNQEETAQLLTKFNEDCYNFYRWAIGEDALKWLRGA